MHKRKTPVTEQVEDDEDEEILLQGRDEENEEEEVTEDAITTLSTFTTPTPKEKHQGRKRLPLNIIESKTNRRVTFSRRKESVMNAAYRLTYLTNCNVFVFVQFYNVISQTWSCHFYASDAWKKALLTAKDNPLLCAVRALPKSKPENLDAMLQNANCTYPTELLDTPVTTSKIEYPDSEADSEKYCVIHFKGTTKAKEPKAAHAKQHEEEGEEEEEGSSTHVEMEEEEFSSSSSSGANKKKTRGKRKIRIALIEDNARRHSTFCKRRSSLMKSSYLISTFTGCQVYVGIHNISYVNKREQFSMYASPGLRALTCNAQVVSFLRHLTTNYVPSPLPTTQQEAEQELAQYIRNRKTKVLRNEVKETYSLCDIGPHVPFLGKSLKPADDPDAPGDYFISFSMNAGSDAFQAVQVRPVVPEVQQVSNVVAPQKKQKKHVNMPPPPSSTSSISTTPLDGIRALIMANITEAAHGNNMHEKQQDSKGRQRQHYQQMEIMNYE